MEPQRLPDPGGKKKPSDKPAVQPSALRFVDVGARMCIVIAIGTFLGKWIDGALGMKSPVFILCGAMIATCGAMYMIIKEVSAKDE